MSHECVNCICMFLNGFTYHAKISFINWPNVVELKFCLFVFQNFLKILMVITQIGWVSGILNRPIKIKFLSLKNREKSDEVVVGHSLAF